ncbi:hypothetical protein [Nonomuraea sp. NPDC048916]|uniref:hypothetical protein n=1 Tax=Nonomuraea sp. NPDC048916 TaxID=3154232 RepID=UPI0033D9814A
MTTEYEVRANGDFGVHGDQPVEKVKRILDSVKPRDFEKAGDAYLSAASMLGTSQRAIEDASKAMADVWGDKASVEAQKALQALHGTIDMLGSKANEMGRPLQSLGKAIPPFKNDLGGHFSWSNGPSWTHGIPDIAVDTKDGWDWFTSDNGAAKEHLKKFNQELDKWHQLLPASMTENLPKLKWPTPDETTYTVPTYPTGNVPKVKNSPNYSPDYDGNLPQGNSPGNTGWQPQVTDPGSDDPNATDPGDKDPNGNGPGNKGDANGDLPGTDQPPIDPASTNPNGTDGSTNGTNNGSVPNINDPRSTGLSDYQPPKIDTAPISTTGPTSSIPSTAYSPTGGPSTSPGGGTTVGTNLPVNMNGASVLRGGASGMGGMGMPFMPMGGMGAGGGEERMSESSTWLMEDDDVWGGPAKDVVDDTIR